MSSDAYGVPQRKYDFGRDIVLAGQALTLGGEYRMQEHLVWARGDSMTAVAGANVYLPFQVPPLPAGSIIRAYMTVGSAAGNDTASLARITDPTLVTGGTATNLVAGNPATLGLAIFNVVIRSRNAAIGSGMDGFNFMTNVSITAVDWLRTNYLALLMTEDTAAAVHNATVEVFIPRAYR